MNDHISGIGANFVPQAPVAPKTVSQSASAQPVRSFADVLQKVQGSKTVTLSAHASQRLQTRGIVTTADTMRRLAQAADTLAGKNARESLVVLGGVGFVLNVPNRTVVTAMALNEGGASVFTNIDSALVLQSE